MTGFVYKWTNNLNGRWYIGSHKGTIDDGYVASGIVIKEAIKKYGIENFTREILYTGDDYNAEEAKLLESLQAKEDVLSYNLTNYTQTTGNSGNKMKSLAGLTYEEIHGEEKAKELKALRALRTGKLNSAYGKNPWNKGKTYTYEELYGEKQANIVKEKKRQAMTGKPQRKVECPHCAMIGGVTLMKRYHYDNCKEV